MTQTLHRYLLRAVLLLPLLSLLLVCGCDSSTICEVRSAALSQDGRYLATVHRMQDRLILSVLDIDNSAVLQREVASPAVEWLPKRDALACEIVERGSRLLAVLRPTDLKTVTAGAACRRFFPSQEPDAKAQPLEGPVPPKALLFATKEEDGWHLNFGIPGEAAIEQVIPVQKQEILWAGASPGGYLVVLWTGRAQGLEALARHAKALGGPGSMQELATADLETPERTATASAKATLVHINAGGEVQELLGDIVWSPDSHALLDGAGSNLALTGREGTRCFKLDFKQGRKQEMKIEEIESPVPATVSLCAARLGWLAATPHSVVAWNAEDKPAKALDSFPLRLSQLHQRTAWGYLATIELEGVPNRHLALLRSDGPRFLPVTGWLARELRDSLTATDLTALAASVETGKLPEFTELFPKAVPHDLRPYRRGLPIAEFALAKGDTSRALQLYGTENREYALRLAELHIVHTGDTREAVGWLAKVEDPAERARADLLIDVMALPEGKLRSAWHDSMRSWDTGRYAQFVESAQEFVERCDEKSFDPVLADRALSAFTALELKKPGERCKELLLRFGKAGRFQRDCARVIARHGRNRGDIDGYARALLELAASDEASALELRTEVMQLALSTGRGAPEAVEAAAKLLEYRLSFEEAIAIRMKLMAIYALLLRDPDKAAEQANHLAWAAFDDPSGALEAAVWSVMLTDLSDQRTGTALTMRFCRNPRAAVRSSVSEIVAWSLRSAISRVPAEQFKRGELPEEFLERCLPLSSLAEIAPVVPKAVFDYLAGTEYGKGELQNFLTNEQADPAARVLQTLALCLMMTEATEAPDEKLQTVTIPISLAFRNRLAIQTLGFTAGQLHELGGNDRSFWHFIAQSNASPLLWLRETSFRTLSGAEFVSRFADRASLVPTDKTGWQPDAWAIAELVRVTDHRSLFSFLESNAGMAVCIPVFDVAADVAILRSEQLEFFDIAAASTASRDKRVVNFALDAMCRVLAEMGTSDKLERTALQLELTGIEEGRYKTSAAYALLWVSITLQQNNTKSARSWRVKWLDRGGLLGKPDDEVFAFLERNEGILAEWVELRSFAVAFWISSLESEDTRKRLIELCGPKAAEVEGMVKELLGEEAREAEGEPRPE